MESMYILVVAAEDAMVMRVDAKEVVTTVTVEMTADADVINL